MLPYLPALLLPTKINGYALLGRTLRRAVGLGHLPPTMYTYCCLHNLYGTYRITRCRSWFCLMPHGDTYSRRNMYDCLVNGAIPVVFEDAPIKLMPYAVRA